MVDIVVGIDVEWLGYFMLVIGKGIFVFFFELVFREKFIWLVEVIVGFICCVELECY